MCWGPTTHFGLLAVRKFQVSEISIFRAKNDTTNLPLTAKVRMVLVVWRVYVKSIEPRRLRFCGKSPLFLMDRIQSEHALAKSVVSDVVADAVRRATRKER